MLIIAGPAESTANLEVATISELRTFGGWDTADATRMQQVVDGINRALYEKLGRRFIKQQGTAWDLLLDASADGISHWLPHVPVVAISLLERGWWDTGGWAIDHTYAASEYRLEPASGRLYCLPLETWPTTEHELRCTYTCGYGTVPHDLKMATLEWMAVEYQRASGGRLDRVSVTSDAGSDQYTFDNLPTAAARVIERYRRRDNLL